MIYDSFVSCAWKTLLCIACAIPVTTPGCKNAQVPSGADRASCRLFAQTFYDWYVPFTNERINGPASNIVLERKPEALDANLFKALKADSDAQSQGKGEVVGIDFDPFVGSQDPADHYEAREVRWNSGRYSVEVWRASAADTGEKTGKPDVIAELAQENGRWRFVDFRYPALGGDLLSALAAARQDRRRLEVPAEKENSSRRF